MRQHNFRRVSRVKTWKNKFGDAKVMSLFEFDKEFKKEGYNIICGVDEAGRGPLAGPVYACAIIMKEDFIIPEVNDSKKLTEKKREALYDIILENALDWSVASVSEKEIDEINILNATMKAMDMAILGLKVVPDLALIDGNQNRGIKQNNKTIIKGDSKSYNIAAASIIAKVTRDRFIIKMDELYPQYGFKKHKGYGTKEHIENIRKYGSCEIHRRTFLKNI
ncbi:MAG: ribonuclease HII [Ruminococcaceae bacterium]|nr:ribonuclease HII [Oscillospiraceae bacterium]